MLNRRDRLVSFRLSEEEYENLRSLSIAQKARSISDFARTALRNVLVTSRNDEFTSASKSMETTITHLTQSMGELSRVISQVVRRIEKESKLQEPRRENANSAPDA
jgi:hypothetical protein